MLNKICKRVLGLSFVLLALLAASMPAAAQNRYNLQVENDSGYAIYKLQMSSVNDNSWERDLLGSYILYDGYSFTVSNISPGSYDIRLIDEDHDACVINDVRVNGDLTWNLTPVELVGCEFR
jgi:hypothetical protein